MWSDVWFISSQVTLHVNSSLSIELLLLWWWWWCWQVFACQTVKNLQNLCQKYTLRPVPVTYPLDDHAGNSKTPAASTVAIRRSGWLFLSWSAVTHKFWNLEAAFLTFLIKFRQWWKKTNKYLRNSSTGKPPPPPTPPPLQAGSYTTIASALIMISSSSSSILLLLSEMIVSKYAS